MNLTFNNRIAAPFAIIAMALSFTSGANAQEVRQGLFVEPAILFELGETSTTYPSPLANASGHTEGLSVGARLGFHIQEAFFLGLDARYGMPRFKDSSVQYNAKAVATNWGPVVGLQMPMAGVRVWASYIAGGELNPEKSGNVDVKFQNSTGYRIGVGLRMAMVSLNLEYQQLKYGKSTLEQLGPFTVGTDFDSVKLEDKAWLASISFPLEL